MLAVPVVTFASLGCKAYIAYMAKIKVQNTEITIIHFNESDYISLTDMANAKESESRAADIIKSWLRNRYSLEYSGTWEQINNPDFKVVEFNHFKSQAGLPLMFQLIETEFDFLRSQFAINNNELY